MLKEQAGHSAELSHPANRKFLEQQNCETVGEVYQTLQLSGLDKFTHAMIHSLLNHLSEVIHRMEVLPDARFKELVEVIDRLGEARNELRLARFLFDVEEINPVYRLIMRNRAMLRGKRILHKTLLVWPVGETPRV